MKYISLSYTNKSRPFIKVQDGCNYACAYCIVPLARGRSRSLESQIVVNHILNLEAKGFNEIVLSGIHLGLYGHDLNTKQKLSDLIETILIKTKIKRIRLSSIEVSEIDDRILELMQERRVCKHLHIPLQSGDDTVLKRMKRMYNSASYLQKISQLIEKNPDIAIGTDVMIGFPGETDQAFLNTRNLIEKIPFSYLHIFPFSSRPSSDASQMVDQVGFAEKKKRYDSLSILNNRKRSLYMSSQLGKTLEIVIEDEVSDEWMVGTSGNYLKIQIRSKGYAKKSLVAVRVAERAGNLLVGIPLNSF